MAARKGCCAGGCLVKTLIALVIIVVIIGGAFLWLINQTPETLGFADVEINGMTIREMGLADTKIKAIFAVIKGLLDVNETDIVTNPYDPVEDKASTDESLNSIGVPSEGDNINYLYLVENAIVTDDPELVEFSDTEIAFLLDAMVQQGVESQEAEGEEQVEIVREMNAGFAQVIINKGQTNTLEMMVKIDISSIKDEIPNIPFVGNMIPNDVFLNSINTLSIDSEGKISTTSQSLEINGMTDEMSTNIINALFNNIAQGETEENSIEYFNNTFGELFRLVINNVGLVGDADTNSSGDVIESTISYGTEGVESHKIKVITRTEAPEEE